MLRESEPPGKLEGTWGRLLPSQYSCLRALLHRAPAMGLSWPSLSSFRSVVLASHTLVFLRQHHNGPDSLSAHETVALQTGEAFGMGGLRQR